MWYIANGTIGKSSSSAAVAEPNYSSAAYQWQSRHYHCPHRTLHASPLQTTASTEGANYGALHQHDIQSRLSTHHDSSTLSMDCKDILAEQCMSVAGQSYNSWLSRIGSQTALQIRTLYWLVKSVQVQEAGKKYELMVNQITKDKQHRLIRKCPSSWFTLVILFSVLCVCLLYNVS